ncbi:Membrane-bound lysozyme-inhibitor of c-type lysozyme [Aquimixticola soesokkakensis]|uniref:Membrane-bound lysozyme-inhibitor of c-type lysozyme n=1 Tax=Aquimixticola soesokkakensis TaxID=1519096 RepID=A0A1Y5TKQ6_9RHOB|nr:MliC family protein [Aquimixticola soesokkakensis]SLN66230.1 Membrane-bound lysozyme-inhibitor of c-type lysozyme [Aquimixticola soesokkakensis]
MSLFPKLATALGAIALSASAAAAQDSAAQDSGPAQIAPPSPVHFTCERGVKIDAVFTGDVAAVLVEGRLISLSRAQSASGARYSFPGGSGYDFWTKGDTARLDWFDAEIGESVTLYARCKTDPA